jgi:hypothetical protein
VDGAGQQLAVLPSPSNRLATQLFFTLYPSRLIDTGLAEWAVCGSVTVKMNPEEAKSLASQSASSKPRLRNTVTTCASHSLT